MASASLQPCLPSTISGFWRLWLSLALLQIFFLFPIASRVRWWGPVLFTTVSSDGDLLGLGSSSVLSRALVKGRHDKAVYVESSGTHSHWDLLCLCPQDWAGISTVHKTEPVRVCVPHTPGRLWKVLRLAVPAVVSSCWAPHLAVE